MWHTLHLVVGTKQGFGFCPRNRVTTLMCHNWVSHKHNCSKRTMSSTGQTRVQWPESTYLNRCATLNCNNINYWPLVSCSTLLWPFLNSGRSNYLLVVTAGYLCDSQLDNSESGVKIKRFCSGQFITWPLSTYVTHHLLYNYSLCGPVFMCEFNVN